MPKITALVGQHIGVRKDTKIVEAEGEEPEMVPTWTLVLTDRVTADQFSIEMNRETRDDVVRQLTEGIVLAGGVFPKL